LGGAQVGYDVQTGPWVFGIEAQGDWGDVKASHTSVVNNVNTNSVKLDGLGLFSGRVGYAWDNVLLYGKGGAAVVHNKYDVSDATPLVFATASETRWSGAAGVGLEVAFTNNWTFATEYVHAFLGNHTLRFSDGTPYAIRQEVDLVSFHLNYRFGGPIVR
jgi:outer membrane immunogenic protein